MPSKSKKQHNLMKAVMAGYSDKVPKKVAAEYLRHDAKQRGVKHKIGKRG